MMYKLEQKEIKLLEVNKGQIDGLPKNPRFIRDNRFDALKRSIEDAPEMLNLRELLVFPHNDKYVVIAGNMRLRACIDLGYKELPCKILPPDTPVEKLREYAIKDNESFGQNDWDILANEWDVNELTNWGVEFGFMNEPDWGDEKNDDIDVPTLVQHASSVEAMSEYSDDTDYDLTKLYRKRINPDIVKEINTAVEAGSVRSEIADILKVRAWQCAVFNFDEIIKFYRSGEASSAEMALLRRLYLVFVAPQQLIEDGVFNVKETTMAIFDDTLMDNNKALEDETD